MSVLFVSSNSFGADYSCKDLRKFGKQPSSTKYANKILGGGIETADQSTIQTALSKVRSCIKEQEKKDSGGGLFGAVSKKTGLGGISKLAGGSNVIELKATEILLASKLGNNETPSQTAIVKQGSRSSSMAPMADARNPSDESNVFINKDENTAICVGGGWAQNYNKDHRSYHVCLPNQQMMPTEHYKAKGMGLKTSVDDLKNCEIPQMNWGKTDVGASFSAVCTKNDTPYVMQIETSKEQFWVSYITVPVCGPEKSFVDGAWDNAIRKRYGPIEDSTLHGNVIMSYEVETKNENIEITARTPFFLKKVVSCSAEKDEQVWSFRISSTAKRMWNDHRRKLIKSNQSGGEVF